jgi:hypothetical protein
VVLRSRKVVLAVGTGALAVASPLAFTLGPAGMGDTVSASIIAATAVAALVVPMWSGGTRSPKPDDQVPNDTYAMKTGKAEADGGGDANTGVRRQRGTVGPVRAERTGPAVAHGPGSRANSGVEDVD